MNETKKYEGLLDNKNARKAREERRTKMIVIPVTEKEKEAFEKHVKRGKRSRWVRELIFTHMAIALLGMFFGWALYMQA